MINIAINFLLARWELGERKKFINLMLRIKLLIKRASLIETLAISFNRYFLIGLNFVTLKNNI